MSMVCPVLTNGGNSAVTVTAATFLSCICAATLAGTGTPNFASMLEMLWIVKGA